MAKRKVADCRLYPSEKNCSLTIAGTEKEVLKVAVRHAVDEHGHKNSPKLLCNFNRCVAGNRRDFIACLFTIMY